MNRLNDVRLDTDQRVNAATAVMVSAAVRSARSTGLGGFLSVVVTSDPPDRLRAEQALGTHEQDDEQHAVGDHVDDVAAQVAADERLQDPYGDATHNGSFDGVHAAKQH